MHSPLGGQGLNLGIGDAMNLGWKLAAVVRGKADEALLDSYQSERHPVGTKVLDWSRAQVALMRPGAGSRALAAIMADLAGTRDGATYLAERIWGVSQQLELGGEHPLVGRSAPDFRLADGRRLGELLRAGQGRCLFSTRRLRRRSMANAGSLPSPAPQILEMRHRVWGGAGAPGWHRCLDLRHRRRYARP